MIFPWLKYFGTIFKINLEPVCEVQRAKSLNVSKHDGIFVKVPSKILSI